MVDKSEKIAINGTLLAWIIGLASSMSSFAYSLETEEPITVNKVRTQPWVRFSADYVRCFCNLPQCISTGYMCKSSGGGCFSNFLDHTDHHSKDYRGRHGCLELLRDREDRSKCENNSGQPTKLSSKNVMLCCYHDMCNHVDSPQTKDLINNTLLGEPQESELQNGNIDNLQQHIDYTNSQVWFRAATIAVPVCGAVILFVLIALAVKILRAENHNSTRNKLGSCSYESHSKCDKLDRAYDILRKQQKCPVDDLQKVQVPLLIQNEINTHHSGSKNQTNAKLNFMQVDVNEYPAVVLDIEKITPKCSNPNVNHVHNDKFVDMKYVNDDKLFINSINQ